VFPSASIYSRSSTRLIIDHAYSTISPDTPAPSNKLELPRISQPRVLIVYVHSHMQTSTRHLVPAVSHFLLLPHIILSCRFDCGQSKFSPGEMTSLSLLYPARDAQRAHYSKRAQATRHVLHPTADEQVFPPYAAHDTPIDPSITPSIHSSRPLLVFNTTSSSRSRHHAELARRPHGYSFTIDSSLYLLRSAYYLYRIHLLSRVP
jgi:hypothetical protein